MRKSLHILLVAALACAVLSGCSAEAKKARRLARAERSFKAGEYDKAKVDYLALLRNDANNAAVIQRLGLIWSEQGGALPALPYLLKTRELDPADIESRLKLATVLLAIGEAAEARREALAILQQAPKNGEALRIARKRRVR